MRRKVALHISSKALLAGIVAVAVITLGHWSKPRDRSSKPESGRSPERTFLNDFNSSEDNEKIVTRTQDNMGVATFEELLRLLQAKRANHSAEEAETFLRQIAKHRPALAIELARQLFNTDAEVSEWTFALAGDWAKQDAPAAWRWLNQISNRPEVTGNLSLLNAVLDQMAIQNPDRLIELTNIRLRDSESTSAIEPQLVAHACTDALIRSGHVTLAQNAIEELVRSVDPARIGAAPLESIALHIAQSSPADATRWLKSLPVSDARNFAAGTLASDWACRDPQAALAWAATLGANEGRSEAMQRAYSEWIERDPVRAVEWLDRDWSGLTFGEQTDRMVANLVAASPMVRTDGEGALLWAALIEEPKLKSDVIAGVFSRWLRSNQATAASFLNNNVDLTPLQKDGILRSFRESRGLPGSDPNMSVPSR